MSAISKKRVVSCPQCGQPAEFSADNPYRPFCSKRCQLVDLGDWPMNASASQIPRHLHWMTNNPTELCWALVVF